jgi:hypothetical protein
VLKSGFGYGGRDVAIGTDSSESSWESVIRSTQGNAWVAQRFVSQAEMRVPVFGKNGMAMEMRYANWSPWLFNGSYAGGMTRISGSMIVSITQRGALLPSLPDEGRLAREDRVAV